VTFERFEAFVTTFKMSKSTPGHFGNLEKMLDSFDLVFEIFDFGKGMLALLSAIEADRFAFGSGISRAPLAGGATTLPSERGDRTYADGWEDGARFRRFRSRSSGMDALSLGESTYCSLSEDRREVATVVERFFPEWSSQTRLSAGSTRGSFGSLMLHGASR